MSGRYRLVRIPPRDAAIRSRLAGGPLSPEILMSIKSLSIQSFPIKTVIGFSVAIALLIVNGFTSPPGTAQGSAAAVGGHGSHGGNHGGGNRPDTWPESEEVQAQISELREATARFHDITVALKEGYAPFGDC